MQTTITLLKLKFLKKNIEIKTVNEKRQQVTKIEKKIVNCRMHIS